MRALGFASPGGSAVLRVQGRADHVRAGVRRRVLGLLLCGLATLGACDRGPAEPDDAANWTIAIFAGNGQFGAPGQLLADPLEVVVTNGVSREGVEGVAVSWRVVDGSGAVVLPLGSKTETLGVARARLRLGSQTGVYRVEARISSGAIRTAVFEARAVLVPEVLAVAPEAVSAGDTVTIAGKNFSPRPEDNTVLFGGLPGTVVEATPTELKAIVPACLPDRTDLPVTVRLGAVASPQAARLSVVGGAHATVRLGVGEAQTLAPESGL
ncbi:MAG TPA: IPT/TIG domain-containing protein, partial [Longimicrobiales bacterium]